MDRTKSMSAEAYIEGLYNAHSGAVRRFLLKLGAQDEAEDIVQETFERFIKHHQNLTFAGGKELAWLFQVARNIWVDRCRKTKRISSFETDFDAVLPEEPVATPLDALFREDLKEKLFEIAAGMDNRGQYALLLHMLLETGVRQTEIARRLSKSERTVRRMIEKLFIQLENDLKRSGVNAEALV